MASPPARSPAPGMLALWWEPSLMPPQPLYIGQKAIFSAKLLFWVQLKVLLQSNWWRIHLCLHVT